VNFLSRRGKKIRQWQYSGTSRHRTRHRLGSFSSSAELVDAANLSFQTPTMASSSSSTREIANAWASFYNQYYNALGGVNQSAGPRSKKVDAARKEWTTILNKLRGGNVRHWPTEPDEIRQIQQLLHWEQCDMWSAIDGVTSARDHIRSTASVR